MQTLHYFHHFLKNEFKTIHITVWFYIFGIGIYSLVFAYLTLPVHGIDENSHFLRSLQISQGDFFPTRYADNALGGKLDMKMAKYASYMYFNHNKITTPEKIQYIKSLNQIPEHEKRIEYFTTSAGYSPIMYIPSITGLCLAKFFHGNVNTRYFSGRVTNVLFYMFLLSIIMLVLPTGRYFVLLFLTTLANLQIAGTYNADTFTNLLALLFIASTFRIRELPASDFPKWRYILFVLSFSLGFLKITYCFLSLFCFLIPIHFFQRKKDYFIFCTILISLSVIPAILWNSLYPINIGQIFHNQDNPTLAIHTLITRPLHVLHLIQITLSANFPNWYQELYGRLINNTSINALFFIKDFSFTFIILLIASILLDTKRPFSLYTTSLSLFMGGFYSLLVFLAFYINFSPIDSKIILGIQGRYFIIAIIPACLGLFYCLPQKYTYTKALPVILSLNFILITHLALKAFAIISPT